MDVDFQNYSWNPNPVRQMAEQNSLIDDLFFGFEAPNLDDLINEDAGRTRRVTVSEDSSSGKGSSPAEDEWMMLDEDVNTDEAATTTSSSDEDDFVGQQLPTTEEIFQILDDAVQDWKIKLEVVVGEGLKRLRKAGKEGKLKIKYLPGESVGNKKLMAPKDLILKEWKEEFDGSLQSVQAKLDKLTRDKVAEVAALYDDRLLMSKPKREPVKKVTIDCRDKKTKGGNYHALKQMVRELDRMVAATQANNFESCVPIYNLTPKPPAPDACNIVAIPFEFPLQKYVKYIKESNNNNNIKIQGPPIPLPPPQPYVIPTPPPQPYVIPTPPPVPMITNPTPKIDIKDFVAINQSRILDALDDMKIKHHMSQKVKEETQTKPITKVPPTMKKEVKRETSAMARRGKMAERREKNKTNKSQQRRKKGEATITNVNQGFTYRLRQYSVNGEEHYLIVKKRMPANADQEVEDIFQDWVHNMEEKRRVRRHTPRVRKLSHRAQRKEYLRHNGYEIPEQGPLSYADALKKNLKFKPNYIPVEDIFEAWRDYLLELDDLLSEGLGMEHLMYSSSDDVDSSSCSEEDMTQQLQQQPLTAAELKDEEVNDDEMGLMECGQPTVKTALDPVSSSFVHKRKVKALQPEQLFAGWRFNLDDGDFFKRRSSKKKNKARKYAMEEIFSDWRRHSMMAKEASPPPPAKRMQLSPMPENIFHDWLCNLAPFSPQHHGHPRHHHVRNQASAGEPLSKRPRSNNHRRSKNKKNNGGKNTF